MSRAPLRTTRIATVPVAGPSSRTAAAPVAGPSSRPKKKRKGNRGESLTPRQVSYVLQLYSFAAYIGRFLSKDHGPSTGGPTSEGGGGSFQIPATWEVDLPASSVAHLLRWQHANRGQRERARRGGGPVESNKYHSSESGHPRLLRVKSDLQHERACMTSSSNPEAPAAGSTLVSRGKCNHLMAQLATEERCRGASDWKAQLHDCWVSHYSVAGKDRNPPSKNSFYPETLVSAAGGPGRDLPNSDQWPSRDRTKMTRVSSLRKSPFRPQMARTSFGPVYVSAIHVIYPVADGAGSH
ncbi:hypothetical protein DFH09DRAFT_1280872 [Mycena vulgaris]|nr:hypothetical protein DFH09DRAFT_1280872 [Mycena vulgaris]